MSGDAGEEVYQLVSVIHAVPHHTGPVVQQNLHKAHGQVWRM